jgi:shikimate kinase
MTRKHFPAGRSGRGLALIGYRGTGKTTVGRIVAARLSRTFLDADLELEARAGLPISRIFSEWGETVFRDWEERSLAELIHGFPEAVVATGGGVVLRVPNRIRICDFGFVVWLTAGPSVLAERLAADPTGLTARPALTSAGTIAEIAQVLELRAPLYQEIADTVIDTTDKSPEEVAAVVVERWAAGLGRDDPK